MMSAGAEGGSFSVRGWIYRTLTLNFNRPVVGRTLEFTVTITYISDPTTGKTAGIAGYALYAPVSQRER